MLASTTQYQILVLFGFRLLRNRIASTCLELTSMELSWDGLPQVVLKNWLICTGIGHHHSENLVRVGVGCGTGKNHQNISTYRPIC